MDINEFKDRLFEILDETDNLPIQDLDLDDKNDTLNIYLRDNTRFSVRVENCGNWRIYKK